jgi:hypothetical protein
MMYGCYLRHHSRVPPAPLIMEFFLSETDTRGHNGGDLMCQQLSGEQDTQHVLHVLNLLTRNTAA